MTENDDQLQQVLACLPSIPRDIEGESRVRARCHFAIARRAVRRKHGTKSPAGASVARLAAAALLCFYLAAMFSEAARLGGPPVIHRL
jgi:hypothetical protein